MPIDYVVHAAPHDPLVNHVVEGVAAVLVGTWAAGVQPVRPVSLPTGMTISAAGTLALGGRVMPVGGIIMWSGALAAIPTGWALCDGAGGRPDLRNRFIYGAHGSGAAPGTTGGSADAIAVAHTHTFTATSGGISANHTHSMFGGNTARVLLPYIAGGGGIGGGGWTTGDYESTGGVSSDHSHTTSGTTASTGAAGTNARLPPYYVLAFIICLA